MAFNDKYTTKGKKYHWQLKLKEKKYHWQLKLKKKLGGLNKWAVLILKVADKKIYRKWGLPMYFLKL